MTNIEIIVRPTTQEAASACALFMGDRLAVALNGTGDVTLAISGSPIPGPVFRLLAARRLDWSRVHVFWVDERCVPHDDPESNYGLAKVDLVDPAGIPAANVHRVRTELGPQDAARAYSEEIERVCGNAPRFDVMQRGLGADAHTASFFPGDPLVLEKGGIAAAVLARHLNQWRVTLMPTMFSAAAHTAMFVPGAEAAEAVARVIEGPLNPLETTAQIATRQGVPETWFLDAASASALTPGSLRGATNRT